MLWHPLVRHPHDGAGPTERTSPHVGHHAALSRDLERPAGTIISGATTAYDPIIGAAQTRSFYNVDGSGMTVAVIDTGVDYNNAALGSGFGPNDKVIAGFDFADNTSDPLATTSQHGTAIAGRSHRTQPNDLGAPERRSSPQVRHRQPATRPV